MSDLTERAKAYLDGWRDEDGHALISELVDRIDELERENAKLEGIISDLGPSFTRSDLDRRALEADRERHWLDWEPDNE